MHKFPKIRKIPKNPENSDEPGYPLWGTAPHPNLLVRNDV